MCLHGSGAFCSGCRLPRGRLCGWQGGGGDPPLPGGAGAAVPHVSADDGRVAAPTGDGARGAGGGGATAVAAEAAALDGGGLVRTASAEGGVAAASDVSTAAAATVAEALAAAAVAAPPPVLAGGVGGVTVPLVRSRLLEHFDKDGDGVVSVKEVAALLNTFRQGRGLGAAVSGSGGGPSGGAVGGTAGTAAAGGDGMRNDVTIDGETLSLGHSDFDLLLKQPLNVKHTRDPSEDPRRTLQEDNVFIKDLVIVTGVATLGRLVATTLQQPPLLGFVLAGTIVGPGGLAAVTEVVEVETFASLGIAFLLFLLGIEFSISELASVRRVAVLGGVQSMCGIVAVVGGLVLLPTLGHSVLEVMALGLAVSLPSTAVVLPCLPTQLEEGGHDGGGGGGGGGGAGGAGAWPPASPLGRPQPAVHGHRRRG